VYFQDLHRKLIGLARERVRAGEFTERGLARRCDISQPHLHNVLKNIRALSDESADRLMMALNIGVQDLLWRVSGEDDAKIHVVPILRNRIGPGTETDFSVFRGNVPLPGWLLTGLVNPVTARLASDLRLPKTLAANDLVLLDQNPAIRSAYRTRGVWIVGEPGGLRARYLRLSGARLSIANEATVDNPEQWVPIILKGRNILDIVRARIVWIGREMETEPAAPADPAPG
jgi:hypothetical protein